MTEAQRLLAQFRDPRLAPHLVSAVPALVWAADGSRVLWANAAGAVLLGAATPAALLGRRFTATDPLAAMVPRLATNLPRSAGARLERLRGLGGPLGRPLACACSRLTLDDGAPAILMVAAEPAGRPLQLAERVRRLLAGCEAPVAVYARDGSLIHATAAAQRLAGNTGLGAIGAEQLAGTALDAGAAVGDSAMGPLRIERFGGGADTVLIATWTETAEAEQTPSGLAVEPGAAATDHGSPNGTGPGELSRGSGQDPQSANDEARRPSAPGDAPPWRRHPLRFVWQMEADGTFTLGSSEFAEAVGPRTLALLGRPWREIAADLALDPGGHVAAAVASRETWSGIMVDWPIDATGERAAVELSGLPIFAHDRAFRGYRGFGVCRDVVRLSPHHEATTEEAGRGHSEQERPGQSSRPAAGVEPRPVLTVVPAAKNVVPFRSASGAAPDKRPALTPVERPALREIGKAPDPDGENGHAARTPPVMPAIEHHGGTPVASGAAAIAPSDRRTTPEVIEPELYAIAIPSAYAPRIERPHQEAPAVAELDDRQAIVDCLPVAVLVYRADRLIYASRALLDWTGWAELAEIAAAGGLDVLFAERGRALPETADGAERTLALALRHGDPLTVDARLFTVPWEGEPALALLLMRSAAGGGDRAAPAAAPHRPDEDIDELEAILETATDGVVRVERDGRIISLNRGAEALFGYDSDDLKGHPFIDLFAPESHRAALDYLDGLSLGGAGVPDGGREVVGRGLNGGQIPLFMTMGRIGESNDRCCAVFRDITRWKRVEQDLIGAKRQAETASSAKSDFLAKISHEIRTPLNAIIGFSEVMMEERFGPLGNDRYRDYLKDIHTSGGHLVSLINDLLDLSKIEAGKVELVFATVDLNALVKECVALMQPQANRERIIIRTSLSSSLPPIVADARSVRQIALNLLSNSIKFTGAGGQVIVSTALGDGGDAILRVRDTGVGMSEQEIATALEPFRQLATSTRWGSGGTGLGLPLTKALAESNGASFKIRSAVDAGTLVEITFRATRVPGR
jgi:PAS domain S-box-containing protein